MSDTIPGRPPTADESYWLKQAESLSPDKSLDRLDTYGKYLFTLVSTLSVLLTGFGIFGTQMVSHRGWLLIPVALACASLAMALFGLDPVYGAIPFNQPESIKDYLNSVVSQRARWIRRAGVCFALAILSAGVTVALASWGRSSTASISMKCNNSAGTAGSVTAALSVKVDFTALPADSDAKATVTGHVSESDLTQGVLIYSAQETVGDDGKLSVSADINQMERYHYFVTETKVTKGGQDVIRTKATLTR